MRWRKHKLLSLVAGVAVLAPALGAGVARAQDTATGGMSTAQAGQVSEGIYDSPFIVTGRVGSVGYQNSTGAYDNRVAEGFNLQWNGVKTATTNGGFETGLMYSHIGSPDANFWGSAPNGSVQGGANEFTVPLQAVFGYNLSDKLNLAAHLGGTMLYRSIGASMITGRGDDVKTGSDTEIFPSAALNVGYSFSNSVAVALRGDYIPTPADDLYQATIGASFAM